MAEIVSHSTLGPTDGDANLSKGQVQIAEEPLDELSSDDDFDLEYLKELAAADAATDDDYVYLSEDVATIAAKGEWKNCIGQQKCRPAEIRRVKGLKDLITAVKDGQTRKAPIRAVGSGHSFSNICPTTGILLMPQDMNNVLSLDPLSLKDPTSMAGLVSVESGMIIRDLNNYLASRGLALETLGAYDGQTLAGAISTGTHGSGIKFGPLASLVCSLTMVTEKGTVYQIEPSHGITDPAKFKAGEFNIQLKQDDDWFYSTLVAMGCMGLIYSYTLRVVPAYLLQEDRTLTTWQQFKPQLAGGISSASFTANRYFEIDINPYQVKGSNAAVTIVRNIPPQGTPKNKKRGKADAFAAIANKYGGQRLLVLYLNLKPKASPVIIKKSLKLLQNKGYVDDSYVVLNVGHNINNVKGYAMELSFDANQDIVAMIDRVLSTFQDAAAKGKGYMAGPIGFRFVGAASAFVAPQQGRVSMMAEFDMLFGIKTGNGLLTYVTQALQSGPNSGNVRVHWGLDLDTVNANEVNKVYPMWNRWLAVYKQLNTTGMWNSVFTTRLGISA